MTRVGVWIGEAIHHREWCGAFVDGLRRHGIAPAVHGDRGTHPCDVAVFWAHKRRRVIEEQRATGGRYIVLERGYLGDRMGRWASAGWDGLNGRANFNLPADPDPRRFETNFGGLLKPWRHDGAVTLLIGQVPTDASVRGVDFEAWCVDTMMALARVSDRPVRFRPHPLAQQVPTPPGAERSTGTLAEDLAEAAEVVTFNSTAGVDAALAGVPVTALDAGSMARPVAARSLAQAPWRPDRSRWAAGLAWCQWTQEEMAAGETWAHLTAGR